MQDKILKLAVPVAIVVGALILGSFYRSSEISKQRSIERQQSNQIKLEKQENCFAMYKTESEKYNNNVVGWKYDEQNDWCEIEYRNSDGTTFERRFY